jgi:hypothetical protein
MDTKHAKAQNSNGPQKGQGPIRHAAKNTWPQNNWKKRKLKMKKSNKIWARNRPWPNKGKKFNVTGLGPYNRLNGPG